MTIAADSTSHSEQPRTLSQRTRRKIIEAATEIFLSTGFSNASMDMVARKASVSKNTIYNHFNNKDDLFGAIITDLCENLLTPLLTQAIRTAGPETALTMFATRFLSVVMSQKALALLRVVIAEALRFPELGTAFYRAGPEVAIKSLAEYLREQNEKQVLSIQEPDAAAEQFLNTLTGYRLIRAALGIETESSADDRDRFIVQVVSNFLKAHRIEKA